MSRLGAMDRETLLCNLEQFQRDVDALNSRIQSLIRSMNYGGSDPDGIGQGKSLDELFEEIDKCKVARATYQDQIDQILEILRSK